MRYASARSNPLCHFTLNGAGLQAAAGMGLTEVLSSCGIYTGAQDELYEL